MRKITPILFGLAALAITPMTAAAVPATGSMAATFAAVASSEQVTPIYYYRRGHRVARRVYRRNYYAGSGYGGYYSPYAYSYPYTYSYPYGYSSYGMGYGRGYYRW